jgi:hypothetical protein
VLPQKKKGVVYNAYKSRIQGRPRHADGIFSRNSNFVPGFCECVRSTQQGCVMDRASFIQLPHISHTTGLANAVSRTARFPSQVQQHQYEYKLVQ